MKKQKTIPPQVDAVVIRPMCPFCGTLLRASLAYGRGYWLCECALNIGFTTQKDKVEWEKAINTYFHYV